MIEDSKGDRPPARAENSAQAVLFAPCPVCGYQRARGVVRCPHCDVMLTGELAAQLGRVDKQLSSVRAKIVNIDDELRDISRRDSALRNQRREFAAQYQQLHVQRPGLVTQLRQAAPYTPGSASRQGVDSWQAHGPNDAGQTTATPPDNGISAPVFAGAAPSHAHAGTTRAPAVPHWNAETQTGIAAPPAGAWTHAEGYTHPQAMPPAYPTKEASPALVQNVLLAIGGVLLSAATIAFTVFAWSVLGIAGRSVILAALTGIAFTLPAVLHYRFKLTATAETVAAFALVVLALDGYAAWRVHLFGLGENGLNEFGYAGIVAALVATVGVTYWFAVPLRLPLPIAALATHAAVVLLALGVSADGLVFAAGCLVLAVLDLVLVEMLSRTVRREGSGVLARLTRASLMTVGIVGLVTSGVAAFIAGWGLLFFTNDTLHRAGGTVVLLCIAGLIVASGATARSEEAARYAAFCAAILLVAATAMFAARLAHVDSLADYQLLTVVVAATVALISVAQFAPLPWRTGATFAMAAASTVPVAFIGMFAALIAVNTIDVSLSNGWELAAAEHVQLATPPSGVMIAATVLFAAAWASCAARWKNTHAAWRVGMAGAVLSTVYAAALMPVWAAVATALLIAAVALALTGTFPVPTARIRLELLAIAATGYALILLVPSESVTLVATGVISLGYVAVALRPWEHNPRLRVYAFAIATLTGTVEAVALCLHFGGDARAVELILLGSTALVAISAWLLRARAGLALCAVVDTLILAVSATIVAATNESHAIARCVAAFAGVLVLGAGYAIRQQLDAWRRSELVALSAAGFALSAVATAFTLPTILIALFGPYGWFYAWLEEGFGSSAAGQAATHLVVDGNSWPGHGLDALTIALTSIAVALLLPASARRHPRHISAARPDSVPILTAPPGTVFGNDAGNVGESTGEKSQPDGPRGLRWMDRLLLVSPGLGVAAFVGVLCSPVPWQAGLAFVTALGVIGANLATWASSNRARWVGFTFTVLFGLTALLWSFASAMTAVVVVGVIIAVASAAALFGPDEGATWHGTLWTGIAVLAEALVVASALHASRYVGAFILVGAAALLVGVTFAFTSTETRFARSRLAILDGLAAGAIIVATTLSLDNAQALATVLTLGGLVVGLGALRGGRSYLGWTALAIEIVACWAWLHVAELKIIEAYTVPAAVAVSVIGIATMRRTPRLSSWLTLGPGIAALLGPTLVLVLTGDTEGSNTIRPMILAIVAAAIMIAGGQTQRQAPFILGATAVVTVAARVVTPLVPQLTTVVPIWIPLGLAGVALIALGATWEQRTHDVKKLVGRVRAME